jgi:hypothetical protein
MLPKVCRGSSNWPLSARGHQDRMNTVLPQFVQIGLAQPIGNWSEKQALTSFTGVISGRIGSWGSFCREEPPVPGHWQESSPCPIE